MTESKTPATDELQAGPHSWAVNPTGAASIQAFLDRGFSESDTQYEMRVRGLESPHDQRVVKAAIREQVAARGGPRRRRPGPPQATTRDNVEAARASLEQDGRPSGEKAIAEFLGVSRGAVRYALGKDRGSRSEI